MKPLIASSVFAIAIFACTEPVSPPAYTGHYPLRAVNGSTIPALAAAVPDGCTEAFGAGAIDLADGVFSLSFGSGYGCPGVNATAYVVSIGGSLTGTSSPLTARAINPLGQVGQAETVMEMSLSLSGTDASLTLPAGALQLAAATTLVFGPRQ